MPSSSVTVSVTSRVPVVPKSWLDVAPVAVAPSPKSHDQETTDPSGSIEPVPSKSQTAPSQVKLKAAVGAWFGSIVRRMIDHEVALALLESAVATGPSYWPVGTGPPESASVLHTWPVPVLQSACRPVTDAGRANPVVAEDLSAQYETTHAPAGASTVGEGWSARFTVSAKSAVTSVPVRTPA